MRIVGGRLKGRSIITPKGAGTRPTADRTREAAFNIITHADWAPTLEGARVIDVFAGSGGLGFEAMSRGATFCLFVDIDHAARGAIRANAEALDLLGATRIHRRSAIRLGAKPAGVGAPFDWVFLDPPYGKAILPAALAALAEGGWLADGAGVMAEMAADEAPPKMAPFQERDLRRYGAAQIAFFTYRDSV